MKEEKKECGQYVIVLVGRREKRCCYGGKKPQANTRKGMHFHNSFQSKNMVETYKEKCALR